jgi:hypothetical protein
VAAAFPESSHRGSLPAQFLERSMADADHVDTVEWCARCEASDRRQGKQHLIEKIRVVQGNRPNFYSAFVNYA